MLEDSTLIREVTVRSEQRYERHCQDFSQLCLFLSYKAALSGVPVYQVDSAYTSQGCSQCGSTNSANRQSQSSFTGWCCVFRATPITTLR